MKKTDQATEAFPGEIENFCVILARIVTRIAEKHSKRKESGVKTK